MFKLTVDLDEALEYVERFDTLPDAVVVANEIAFRKCRMRDKGLTFRQNGTRMWTACAPHIAGRRILDMVYFEIEEVC